VQRYSTVLSETVSVSQNDGKKTLVEWIAANSIVAYFLAFTVTPREEGNTTHVTMLLLIKSSQALQFCCKQVQVWSEHFFHCALNLSNGL